MALPKQLVVDFKQVNDDLYFDPIIGDFVLAPSDPQHVEDILRSAPGWWKNSPTTGANISVLLKGKIDIQKIENTIKTQLEADGYQVGRPSITKDANGKYIISPNAERI